MFVQGDKRLNAWVEWKRPGRFGRVFLFRKSQIATIAVGTPPY
jgi:hypothetical protein